MKDSFILFTSYAETVKYMSNESAGLLFKMILDYSATGDAIINLGEDAIHTDAYIAFTFIKRQLDSLNEKYEKSMEKQREAGKKGAEKRWGKDSKSIGSDGEAIGSNRAPIAEDSNPIGSDSESIGSDSLYEYEYDKKEKPSKEGKKKKADLLGLDDPVLLAAVKDYENHRKKIKAPLTERALDLALKKLEELAPGDTPTKVEIINQSIMNGWKGLFELKKSKPPDKPTRGMEREEDLDAMVLGRILNRG